MASRTDRRVGRDKEEEGRRSSDYGVVAFVVAMVVVVIVVVFAAAVVVVNSPEPTASGHQRSLCECHINPQLTTRTCRMCNLLLRPSKPRAIPPRKVGMPRASIAACACVYAKTRASHSYAPHTYTLTHAHTQAYTHHTPRMNTM